jgi:CHAT domain-containing protein/Flp pilus assembly protein TadD
MKAFAAALSLLGILLQSPGVAAESPGIASALDRYRTATAQGDYQAAAEFAQEAQALGALDPGLAADRRATIIFTLGQSLGNRGRYAEAEPLIRRSLDLRESALGRDHADVAESLHNLASLYFHQGRPGEAEPLLLRALAIREKALGPDHPAVAETLGNLGLAYSALGRGDEAEALYLRSLAIREKAYGPDHPEICYPLTNLAMLYLRQGRADTAEALLKRVLGIREKSLGAEHPDVAATLSNLALAGRAQGRFLELEPLFKRALAIREKTLGNDHPGIVVSLNHLAWLYFEGGALAESLDLSRRVVAIHRTRMEQSGSSSEAALAELKSNRPDFLDFMFKIAAQLAKDDASRGELMAEAFVTGQLAHSTSAAVAISHMAARFASGSDRLANLVRDRQDAANRLEQVDGGLVRAAGLSPELRDSSREKRWRDERSSLGTRIRDIDTTLTKDFPQFVELSQPAPASLLEIQSLLAVDEALVSYHVWQNASLLFVIRRDRAILKHVALGEAALQDAVTDLRNSLDLSGVRQISDLRPFNRTAAFELYKTIFKPAEPLLDGARHVFVVPDGALQSLPLGVLVTDEPLGDIDGLAAYRQVPWLAKKYAMSVLPSVSALRALRTFAKRSRASRPFLGIGDPDLDGAPGAGRGARPSSASVERGVADVRSVRSLGALPESADELRTLASILKAGTETVVLRDKATESWIKSSDLSDRKVIAFATHGLVAGDLEGLAESALVLTPPETGTALDDGLLTASEVAQLKLDADWVILSACNTAAGDDATAAGGLSGLARAFFYAGTRAILVSHWPVASDAAVLLTTRMLAETAKPGVGGAEAHRRAMLSLHRETEPPQLAHPAFWAPFIVVGEGGTFTKR